MIFCASPSFGAGYAGAMGYQILVRVYPRVVGVAPKKLEGIVAHLHLVQGADILWNSVRVKARPPGHLVDTAGARATKAEESMRVRATMAVVP